MPDLAWLQTTFGHALQRVETTDAATPHLRGDRELNHRRLALYRGNVIANWTQALAAHYPVIKKFLGDDFFAGLARAYSRIFPSQQGDLGRFGSELAQFLKDFPPTQEFPFLSDLAQLEWLAHEAENAADIDNLQEGQTLLDLPGTAVLASAWPVASLWNMHQTVQTPDWNSLHWQPEGALIFREGWNVKVTPIAHEQAVALSEHLSSGTSL